MIASDHTAFAEGKRGGVVDWDGEALFGMVRGVFLESIGWDD